MVLSATREATENEAKSELDCAKLCTYENSFECKSFEYCNNGKCLLRKEHFYGSETKKTEESSESTQCDLYARKYNII